MSIPIDAIEALEQLAWALLSRDDTPEHVRGAFGALRASVDAWLGGGGEIERGDLCEGIHVPLHGDWLRLPSGAHVDLRNRRALRRLAHALVAARIARPGVPLDAVALIAATWPSANPEDIVTKRRLQVSLSRLRRAGLDRFLLTTSTHAGAAWMIDPDVPMTRHRADARPIAA